ncbi:MAG: putative 7-carboxy-7-deazaguanine synthase QueE [Clostridia bacterium]|nr:putative 7-carboxy-7-deazaguanine synthase QueE [Clostridia bacterium]
MPEYKVAEIFTSINGEGKRAGQIAHFIRFCGCNLACGYCDTKWANVSDAPFTSMTEREIADIVDAAGISNITVTGGEPLIQPDIIELLSVLRKDGRYIEIETNGAVKVDEVIAMGNSRPSLTMDYKLPSSGMERYMIESNLDLLDDRDTIKFVAGDTADLRRAKEVIEGYALIGRVAVYIGTVFGRLRPDEVVRFMLDNAMNGVNLQLQMHKYIWDENARGV